MKNDYVVALLFVHIHKSFLFSMTNYDHIILGTGQATGTLLGQLIPSGDSIAVVEGAKVGGSCVNYGCTPTKTMVASARAIHMARKGQFYGFETGPVKVKYEQVRARMNDIRNQSSEGLTNWMESTSNVSLIREWGSFESAKTIRVGKKLIEGKNIYINVGTYPFVPPIEGIQEVPWMDSAKLLDLQTLPNHLLIIGGGYIGVEFSQIFKRLGAEVTIIQAADQLMPAEDADVAESILSFLKEEGIQVAFNAKATSVSYSNGKIHLTFTQNGQVRAVEGSHLLVATGRRPNTKGLNLEAAGIHTDNKGYITVDEYCRTRVEGVFAVGDVNDRGAFTHTSVNDAEIVMDFLHEGHRKLSDRLPIYGLFTDPPLGRVGMTEKEAIASGRKVLKSTKAMNKISRAKEMGETNGFAKLLVDADSDIILGASILGPGGDEIVNMFAAIMHSGIPCRRYREVVLVHPTVSELMPYVLDGLEEIN